MLGALFPIHKQARNKLTENNVKKLTYCPFGIFYFKNFCAKKSRFIICVCLILLEQGEGEKTCGMIQEQKWSLPGMQS